MGPRCPCAVFIDTALLVNYKFIINSRGVATIIPRKSNKVYGVLWEITSEDEKILDNYEGVKYGTYYKEILNVPTSKQEFFLSLLYIATDIIRGYPRASYMEVILTSAIDHGFPDYYIKELRSWLNINKKSS
jgi:hypothetical protein